jgi:hypothetical protein
MHSIPIPDSKHHAFQLQKQKKTKIAKYRQQTLRFTQLLLSEELKEAQTDHNLQ